MVKPLKIKLRSVNDGVVAVTPVAHGGDKFLVFTKLGSIYTVTYLAEEYTVKEVWAEQDAN